MAVFLPLITQENPTLFEALNRIGPILIHAENSVPFPRPAQHSYLLLDANKTPVDVQVITSLLDEGIDKVIVPISWAKELIGVIPRDRIFIFLDVASAHAVSDKIRNGVSGVLLKTPAVDFDLISSISNSFDGSEIYVLPSGSEHYPSLYNIIQRIKRIGATLVIPDTQLTLDLASDTQLNVAVAFLAPIISDRHDHLIPTVVCSQSGHALGLVYSSHSSVKESITTGKGVYQSRKHGLWRKGETSGATQDIVRIRLDCDTDSLEFRVIQHGDGFCHLKRHSCFGEADGFSALETTLQTRLKSAPPGSYTKRLFDDSDLLRSKIMEEADELCQANTPEDVAFEAADLFYFILTKCIKSGVSIMDIERSLDKKAKRITRRPGNAKPQWATNVSENVVHSPLNVEKATEGPISMRSADLSQTSAEQRSLLLRRPVLKSEDMINKVKPIVEAVRQRGDEALLDLTAKFDKAHLSSTVVFSPFPEELMKIDEDVRKALDVAYANIRKFHEAQKSDAPLRVETMPGVVCSRFARPIARVGLYVPGGTAILPSTALMLGIPAQVAGCKEITLATPPRPDGSVSPEVVYVAHLVGASAILKAGGAQAVAAMAYGTKTVPKVDKIFGPGNQWVTAAKMLVQNDTDALVSIDMPAGPSEVLVIADHTANPAFVAADLLSQAEHGVDSQVVLIAVDLTPEHLAQIEKEVDEQANALPRVDIMRVSISKSLIVKAKNVEEAFAFSNDYAPEHLILHLDNAAQKVSLVENAGSVFVGPYTPESCGDYASGTNHTLPTNGYARQFSGVNTLSFQKHITSQEITAEGLDGLGPVVATLADCEGLQAHANAVRIRLRQKLEQT